MQVRSGPNRQLDPTLARAQYRGRADRYDMELLAFEPVRSAAIANLAVGEGATVLDVGCGTGLSFDPLKERIGAKGHIVGIEPSPEMLAHARTRIARHHWTGIELVQATAAAAPLRGRADGALFHFTHDVLQDEASVDHLLAHLKPGASVVAAGLQWAPSWCVPVNMFVLGAAYYSVTCLGGLQSPWQLLASRVKDLQVRTFGLGGVYIATGHV